MSSSAERFSPDPTQIFDGYNPQRPFQKEPVMRQIDGLLLQAVEMNPNDFAPNHFVNEQTGMKCVSAFVRMQTLIGDETIIITDEDTLAVNR